jgi:hypothetical protein
MIVGIYSVNLFTKKTYFCKQKKLCKVFFTKTNYTQPVS